MLPEQSLCHLQGALITQTCSPEEKNKEPWKMEQEEAVVKDPGMVEGLVKGWQGIQVNVEVGCEINFATLSFTRSNSEASTEKNLLIGLSCCRYEKRF